MTRVEFNQKAQELKSNLLVVGFFGLLFQNFAQRVMYSLSLGGVNVLSLSELYFVDLMTHPLPDIKRSRLVPRIRLIGRLLADGAGLIARILPASVASTIESLDAVAGDAMNFFWEEIKGLLKYFVSFKALLLIPVVLAAVVALMPASSLSLAGALAFVGNVFTMPEKLMRLAGLVFSTITIASTALVVSLPLSVIIGKPLYRLFRLESVLLSVTFSVLNNLAAKWLVSVGFTAALPVYALALLPLMYFASRSSAISLTDESSFLSKVAYMVGSTTLVTHFVKIVCVLASACGYEQHARLVGFLTNDYVRAGQLITNAAVSSLNLGNDLLKSEAPAHDRVPAAQ